MDPIELDSQPIGRVRWPEFAHVVFDCDSTLSTIEGIDILASGLGLEREVAAMTDAAMAGQVDLSNVYGARLEILQPSRSDVAQLRASYKRNVTPDAAAVVDGLHEIGIEVYVVSGGLQEPVEDFAVALGIDPAHVAAVSTQHDQLSGKWWSDSQEGVEQYAGYEAGALTRSDGKADVIARLLEGRSGRTMLVGDGASDLAAAGAVDLFVGFGGVVDRPRVRESAPIFVSAPSLAPILPLAAGPGGAARFTSEGARTTLQSGLEIVRSGGVTFKRAGESRTLLDAFATAGIVGSTDG